MMANIGDLNIYDFFRLNVVNIPTPPSEEESRLGKTVIDGVEKTYKKGMKMSEYTPWAKGMIKHD